MISHLSLLASPVVFPVEPVVPGVLQAILRILVELRGGTGGTANEGSTSITATAGPTSSTRRYHMAALKSRAVPPVPPVPPPNTTVPRTGMKSLYPIAESTSCWHCLLPVFARGTPGCATKNDYANQGSDVLPAHDFRYISNAWGPKSFTDTSKTRSHRGALLKLFCHTPSANVRRR